MAGARGGGRGLCCIPSNGKSGSKMHADVHSMLSLLIQQKLKVVTFCWFHFELF